MLAITGYPALDVFIGLAFLYFLLSVVCSSINEALATALNLRARTLEDGLRQLLGGEKGPDGKTAVDRLYEDWRIDALRKPRRLLPNDKPSYIPSSVFGLAVLDLLAPADASADVVVRAEQAVETMNDGRLKKLLTGALAEAEGDRDKLRKVLERSFDHVMQRASGWYKRRVQLILFVIAVALVGAINADSFTIGQRLWKDDVLRNAVVAQASSTVNTATGSKPACAQAPSGGTAPTPAQAAGACLDQVKQLNLPLGWAKASSPSTFVEGLAKALGLLLTAFALTLGAPFWFDTLSKLAQLRGTGRASSDPGTTEGAKS